jgi:hypothetical protein
LGFGVWAPPPKPKSPIPNPQSPIEKILNIISTKKNFTKKYILYKFENKI